MLRERLQRKRARVHVAVGPRCNNNCIFCMEEDRDGRARVNAALTAEHVRSILEDNRDTVEEVCFTSGEPTLVEQLPDYLRWARELGYPRVSVTTNGRRLAYDRYCAHLVTSGANMFYISIHGHTAKLHDGLARTPGAFEQAVAGLDNVARRGVTIHTSTVVTRRNLPHLRAIHDFLRARGAEQMVFNAMQANGRAHTHFDMIFPRYTDIATAFRGLLAGLSQERSLVFLVDVPPCITEGVADFNRGWVEAYVHHEADGDGHTLKEKSRAEFDHERRSKGPACARCSYEPVCEGVWNNYLDRFGWDEFEPVP